MNNLSFQYPAWYVILCLLLGLGCALTLYFRDKSFHERSNMLNWALGLIRFLAVSLISMLLLSPLLKTFLTETKKPVVVLAQDHSESITSNMTEAEKATYEQNFKQLSSQLSEKYDLKEYAFGSEVREGVDFDFKDKVSNISSFLNSLYDLYSNQNLGAVVLATDGIYNEGSNPIYASTKLATPIYTVALGDTTPRRDLLVKRVFHNKIAYLGDKFTIQVDVAAQNAVGSNTNLKVSKMVAAGKYRDLQQFPISINKNDFFTTKEILLDADQAGVQRYRISLNGIPEEATKANNTKDIFVDVLDARQKILVLANSPHPDVAAIKQAVGNNKNYELTSKFINDSNINVAAYDFVVLHQLPSKTNDALSVINTIKNKKIPHLYVVGSQTNLQKFNQQQSTLIIKGDGNDTNDVQATIAGDFSLFTINDNVNNELTKFAPLIAPFGDYKAGGNTQTFLYQRIGKVDTKYPLLSFSEKDNIKTGVLCAEGIWKWRLFDYLQHENHDIFNEVISKSVQYLSLKEDKRKFRVSINKNIFNENEPIIFDAELYNESYELVNEADASLVVTNSAGKHFDFTFNKTPQAYTLNAGRLPVDNYTFKGTVFSNGENLAYNGQFSIQPVQLEVFETTADHALLRLLSEKYGGEMVYPAQIASIGQIIQSKGTVKPIIYETSKTRSIINEKWIFFFLIGLLILEWFLRRYFGGY